MQIYEIRSLSKEDIAKELESSYKELMNVRFRLATHQLSDTSQIKKVRKSIAQIKTVQRERELVGSEK